MRLEEQKLIVFTKDGCGPCSVLKPVLEKMSNFKGFQLEVINLEEETKELYVEAFSLKTVPTVIHIYNDKEVGRFSGVKAPDVILNFMESNLKNA